MALELVYSVHPGEIVKEDIMPSFNISISDAASKLDVARPGFSNFLNGSRSLTVELALKLERVFNCSAPMLLQMQSNYDLQMAKMDEKLNDKLNKLTSA
jgi:addiction module HigA family antidote